MAVAGNVAGWIAGVIDQDFLSDEEDSAGGLESLDIECAIRLTELHQVDARQIAGRVVEEHVLAARVAGVDPATVGAGVPVVDCGVVLHAGIAAVPGTVGHPIHHVAGIVGGASLIGIGHPAGGPVLVLLDSLHEVVGDANREIRILEHDRAIRLAIEVGLVATLLDQHAGLLLFLPFALDEFHHVGMPDLDRLHLGSTAGLAAALDHRGDLVVHPHEGERTAGMPAAGEFFAVRPQGAQVGARATAKLEEHRLAAGQLHDVFHVVLHMLNEAGRTLGILVWILRLHDFACDRIPAPVAFISHDAVLMVEAHVEPDGRVERAMLMQAEPSQVAVEPLAVGGAGEVAVFETPIGDRAGHPVDQLADAVLPLLGADFAVEVFAADDVGRKLRPERGDFAIGLLEQHFAILTFDGRRADFPTYRIKGVRYFGRAKGLIDLQSAVKPLGRLSNRPLCVPIGSHTIRLCSFFRLSPIFVSHPSSTVATAKPPV